MANKFRGAMPGGFNMNQMLKQAQQQTVSYTHLTLPTN